MLMESGGLRAVFQPIVDLRSGRVVGREALARGPVGSELEMPGPLFASAIADGVLAEFDRACREVALSTATSSGLFGRDLLFLNVEPAGLDLEGVLDPVDEGTLADVAVVMELTERALASRPSEVLSAVAWLRERGCRIALDDVGIDPRSLGLMPFLAPDLIKLDMRLTKGLEPEADTAHVLHAVRAEAERSGAVVLATFQDRRFFTARIRRRYERLARDAALVGALGVGMPSEPGECVRGAALSPDDGLAGEWDVVVGPHFARAFVARDMETAASPTWTAASPTTSPTTAPRSPRRPGRCSSGSSGRAEGPRRRIG